MKRSQVTWKIRYILLIILLLVLAFFFIFPPIPHKQPVQPGSYMDQIITEQQSDVLQPDELEPYRYSVEIPEIEVADAGWTVEAESGEFPDGARVLRRRSGFSGIGYVSNLPEKTESALKIPVTVPYTQHYSVTVCAGSYLHSAGALRIDGELLSQFTLDGGLDFIRVTFYGIFLTEGEHTVSIDIVDSKMDIDYIEFTNDNSVYNMDYQIAEEPCNPNASDETKKLYRFLRDNWGKCMLTGQYVSDSRNMELGIIHEITGQLPAIRFGELGTDNDLKQIEAATDWHVYMNGVVGLMWQWAAPDSGSVYAADTSFNLEETLRYTDISALAAMSYEDAEQAAAEGTLSSNVLWMLSDIDEIAGSLRKLANMDIPVLWRPLHEAGGDWYWWGASGDDAYIRLWRLLYRRLTDYHGLNNLIWVWNGQSTTCLVPTDTYDIASVDVYLPADHTFGSRYEQFLSLARITNGRKMLALSECSALPDLKMISVDSAVWSFFGLWYGEYIMKPDGSFSDAYYSSNDLYNLYNSKLALSLNDFLSLYQ